MNPRALTAASGRLVSLGVASIGLLAFLVLYAFDPAQNSFYPQCWLHRWTGWQCPGCGALRASYHLMHGDVAGAFALNPLFLLSLPFLAGFGALCAGQKIKGRPAHSIPAIGRWAFVALALGFGVWRNLPAATSTLVFR